MELKTHVPTPLQRFYHWEKSRPSDIYMTQPMGDGTCEEFTWARTGQEVRRMANYLKSLNLPEKSKIGILSKNCAYWIMSDLAIWMAGHIAIPLYPTLHADSVRQILDHSETKVLFVGKLDDWDTMKDGVDPELLCISYPLSPPNDFISWDDIIAKTAPMKDSPDREHEELATIIYTSGSTGMPKGVMTSFQAMAVSADGAAQELGLTKNDRTLSYLPLSHVFERFVVEMASLNVGFRIFFSDSLDTFLKDLRRARPTIFMSVPRLWSKFQSGVLAKMPEKKLNRLLKIPVLNKIIKKKVLTSLGLEHVRIACSGSAPLSHDILSWFRKMDLELLEGYGMSENFAYSHINKPGRTKVGYVGEPMPGVQQRISEEGEVQIKSPGTMMGYYKDPEKTKEAFTEDGWLRTGDRGEIDELGRLKLTGRTKELFKTSKGKYVAPAPIETKVAAHAYIEMACVAGADYGQPCCLIMLSESKYPRRNDPEFRKSFETELLDLTSQINNTLDPHEQLQFMVVVKDLWTIENEFLTPTMKMKRNAIEDEYNPFMEQWYAAKSKVIWQ
jgi:long-chain acyl-CoA synthetase